MDPITPLTKQELENRGWQMTTVENPTPDPGPTVVQQMRLEFATIKAYKGSEGRSRTLRFKLFGVAEADLPNIRLEFGRFIKTRHTAADSLADKGAAPSKDFMYGRHYQSKGFVVPNPARCVCYEGPSRRMGCVGTTPFNVPVDGQVGIDESTMWRKPFRDQRGDVSLIGRTKLQASSVNPNEYVAVDPSPDKQVSTGNPTGNPTGTILTLTDFIVPFVSLYMDHGTRRFFASHHCGNVTTERIQSGVVKSSGPLVSLRFVKCGFRLVNVVTGDTSPVLEFVPVVMLIKPTPGWGVIAHVSYGSYNPKRHFTATG